MSLFDKTLISYLKNPKTKTLEPLKNLNSDENVKLSFFESKIKSVSISISRIAPSRFCSLTEKNVDFFS